MSEAILVGRVGDIEDEEALVVPRADTGHDDDIAVFFSAGKYRAIDDTCTHEKASLAEGWIEGDEVECPIHSAKFSLCTGAALCLPASVGVRTHLVEVRGDELWLHPGVPAPAAGDGS
jgi:3-phenylpropionate/trans-cinnamate dioxygenase ferredoxin component